MTLQVRRVHWAAVVSVDSTVREYDSLQKQEKRSRSSQQAMLAGYADDRGRLQGSCLQALFKLVL
jgi:hypothetical protein